MAEVASIFRIVYEVVMIQQVEIPLKPKSRGFDVKKRQNLLFYDKLTLFFIADSKIIFIFAPKLFIV